MNPKIQAILLTLAIDLKGLKWQLTPDWEITLKSEGYIPISRTVPVEVDSGEGEYSDNIEVNVQIKLITEDEITFFPKYNVYGVIFVEGGVIKDIEIEADADVAFTEKDFNNKAKIKTAARRINDGIISNVEHQYEEYIDKNINNIQSYKQNRGYNDQDFDK